MYAIRSYYVTTWQEHQFVVYEFHQPHGALVHVVRAIKPERVHESVLGLPNAVRPVVVGSSYESEEAFTCLEVDAVRRCNRRPNVVETSLLLRQERQ